MKTYSLEEVERAMAELEKAGKRPTLPAIRMTLGGRGSYATIGKDKKLVMNRRLEQQDNEEALRLFREFYNMAREAGKKQTEAEMAAMEADLNALGGEAEEGAAQTAERISRLETELGSSSRELKDCKEQLVKSQASVAEHCRKIAESAERHEQILTKHAAELADLLGRLASTEKELSLAREQLSTAQTRLSDAGNTIESLHTGHQAELGKLQAQLEHEKEQRHAREVQLARIEGATESRSRNIDAKVNRGMEEHVGPHQTQAKRKVNASRGDGGAI